MNYKYYVMFTSNGSLQLDKVASYDDINKAIVAFHQKCAALWNEPSVIEGIVEIVYSADLNVVGGYKERIEHPQVEA